MAARAGASATPDGYTLYMPAASAFVTLAGLQPGLPLKLKDFKPIGFIGEQPMFLTVPPALGASTIAEFLRSQRSSPASCHTVQPGAGR